MLPRSAWSEVVPRQLIEGGPAAPIDKSTRAPVLLAINGIFMSLSLIATLARLCVRRFMLNAFGIDDWFISAAMICGVVVFICFVGETSHGMGMHVMAISPPDFIEMLHWQYYHNIVITVGISLVKVSIAFFLLRLVPSKGQKRFLMAMIAFLAAFTIACAGTLIWACDPIKANWDITILPANKHCFTKDTFTAIGMFNSVVTIITDIIFTTFPIPMIWSLQINIRSKIALCFVLSLGLFSCIASIIKCILQSQFYSNKDITRNDSYFIWNSLEIYFGILAASLPPLRPLSKKILETTSYFRTRKTGYANTDGTDGKYYQEDSVHLESVGKTQLGRQATNITTSVKSLPSEKTVEQDSDSIEEILPRKGGGIMKTVNVRIS